MTKVRFNECLNKETRFFNISIGVILGSCTTGITVWALKNLLFGVAASVVGAVLGSFLMKEYRRLAIFKRTYIGDGLVQMFCLASIYLHYTSGDCFKKT